MKPGPVLLLLFIALVAGDRAAAEPLLWYDPSRLGGEVGETLARYQGLACGPPQREALPIALPDDARLLLLSCQGGPHPCQRRSTELSAPERGFACPARPSGKEILTVQFVSRRSSREIGAHYAGALGPGFELLAGEDGELAVVERVDAPQRQSWSPRRLRLSVFPARGPLAEDGYASRTQITFSLTVPFESLRTYDCLPREAFLGLLGSERERVGARLRQLTRRCLPDLRSGG